MFLIEYEKNCFIDAEKIVFIGITNSSQISFTIAGSGNKFNAERRLKRKKSKSIIATDTQTIDIFGGES